MADDKGSLPPGWDMKFDSRTGKFYFINHYTKTTSWEDPRDRYQQIGKAGTKEKDGKDGEAGAGAGAGAPLANQQVATMRRELEAEQEAGAGPRAGRQLAAGSPVTGQRAHTPQMGYTAHASLGRLQLDTEPYDSPLPSQRSTLRRDSHILAEISELESSFTSQESAVAKISSMFPTVEESHIRDLYKKYLKSVFPTVEEYLLLDVLANSENNVQKTADKLSKMGYVRRETPAAPRLHAKRKEEERLADKRTPLPKPPPIKTEKEKDDIRRKIKEKYEKKFDIPERILFMALESVLFDEDQANNLIQSMIEDDLKRQKAKEAEKARERAEKKKSPKPIRKVVEAERPKPSSPKKVARPSAAAASQDRRGFQKASVRISEDAEDAADGAECRSLARGPNPALRKGPNDDLLLTDYVTWNGPNAALRKGAGTSVAKGPNPANVRGPAGRAAAAGPDPANRRGPQGLAKGSIYSSFKSELPARSN